MNPQQQPTWEDAIRIKDMLDDRLENAKQIGREIHQVLVETFGPGDYTAIIVPLTGVIRRIKSQARNEERRMIVEEIKMIASKDSGIIAAAIESPKETPE